MRLYYDKLPTCTREREALYHKQSDIGVADEVGDLLYALIRVLKPQVCLETGTNVGDSAQRIGQALRDNGFGHLHTCDIDERHVEAGRKRFIGLPITVHQTTGRNLIQSCPPPFDFVFIDSGSPDERRDELMLLDVHNISPLGIVAWHDACVAYERMYDAFAPARDWPHLVIPTDMTGIAVFQRPERKGER